MALGKKITNLKKWMKRPEINVKVEQLKQQLRDARYAGDEKSFVDAKRKLSRIRHQERNQCFSGRGGGLKAGVCNSMFRMMMLSGYVAAKERN